MAGAEQQQAGYEVDVVADAVGGTSVTAHEMALRRIEQAGGRTGIQFSYDRA